MKGDFQKEAGLVCMGLKWTEFFDGLDVSMPETGLTVQMLTAAAYIGHEFESSHPGDQAFGSDGVGATGVICDGDVLVPVHVHLCGCFPQSWDVLLW